MLTNQHLKFTLNCSSCSIRKQCDNLCKQVLHRKRDDINILELGIRGSITCIRLHSAYAINNLYIPKIPN